MRGVFLSLSLFFVSPAPSSRQANTFKENKKPASRTRHMFGQVMGSSGRSSVWRFDLELSRAESLAATGSFFDAQTTTLGFLISKAFALAPFLLDTLGRRQYRVR